jgi:hypothetical protein
MARSLKGFFWMLVFCLLVSHAHAAKPSGEKITPQKPTLAAPTAEVPSMQVPETTYDFGEVMEGGEVSHDFKVKNTGKAVLQIDQVRPG